MGQGYWVCLIPLALLMAICVSGIRPGALTREDKVIGWSESCALSNLDSLFGKVERSVALVILCDHRNIRPCYIIDKELRKGMILSFCWNTFFLLVQIPAQGQRGAGQILPDGGTHQLVSSFVFVSPLFYA